MRILVTGSAGHLGEGLVRTLRDARIGALGLDIKASAFTDVVGSITDRAVVRECMRGIDAVLHTATLHKPHLATHAREAFVATNISGTLVLLEEAVAAGVGAFVFTSTTSVFGHALTPAPGAPAAWVTEDVVPTPKNIYGATKLAAESLCELLHAAAGLPLLILRTSRFFAEPDDRADLRAAYDDQNIKINELLYRRVDLDDVVRAHLLAIERAPALGFGRYIVSAPTPFTPEDLAALHRDAPAVVRRRIASWEPVYASRGWRMFPQIERVYVSARARRDLGWTPTCDFASAIERLASGEDPRSALARTVGAKGYHDVKYTDGLYPVC